MAKKNPRNTRGRIVSAAWQLFYEQGYENTTVEEIIETSQTSKGSFYHYFDGKDALLSTLSDLFDEKYEALQETMDPAMPAMDKLLFLNSKRTYYRLLRKLIAQGQEAGELSDKRTVSDMVKLYALCERALMYDWCLCGGEYSLRDYASQVLPTFLSSFSPDFTPINRSGETP